MVVEHAERFGLAQLHQLRGRVGRGAAKSYCILITGPRVSEQAEERLNAMVRTQDGFELAELDLSMRGPGEFFGTRQAGLPDFRVANLVRDRALLELAKREAERFATVTPGEDTKAEQGTRRGLVSKKPGSAAMDWSRPVRGLNAARKTNYRPPLPACGDVCTSRSMLTISSWQSFLHHPRALAKFRKTNVGALAEFQSRGNQNAVDLQAGAPFEFKQDVDQARIACAAAEHPASAAQNRAGKGFHRPARFLP